MISMQRWFLPVRSRGMSLWQEERVADADPLLSEAGQNQILRLSLVYLASARHAAVQPDSLLLTAGSKLWEEVGRLSAQAGCHLSPYSLAPAPPWDAPICLLLISFRQGVQGRTSGYSDANAAVVELNFLISSMPLCLSRRVDCCSQVCLIPLFPLN